MVAGHFISSSSADRIFLSSQHFPDGSHDWSDADIQKVLKSSVVQRSEKQKANFSFLPALGLLNSPVPYNIATISCITYIAKSNKN